LTKCGVALEKRREWGPDHLQIQAIAMKFGVVRRGADGQSREPFRRPE